MIARKPIRTLLIHMVALLVEDGRLYEPVAISYIKTLRTLLSYPPHLEHMEDDSWRRLMTICWAAILGDRIPTDNEWHDGGENLDEDAGSDAEDDTRRFATAGSSNVINEIITLVPILLSASSAPLIPPPPAQDVVPKPALGLSILHKIHRYIAQHQGIVPIDILRSLNILLGELELNSRQDFTQVSLKIFPQMAAIWTAKIKGDLGHREHVMVALRTMLPFITHPSVNEPEDKEVVREAMVSILDLLPKEAGSRAAIKPLDLEALKFKAGGTKLPEGSNRPPFELMGVTVSSVV